MMKKFKEMLTGTLLIITVFVIMIFGACCKSKEMEENTKPKTEVTETIITENVIVENILVE